MKNFLRPQSLKVPPAHETVEQQHFVSYARYLLKESCRKLLFSIPNEAERNPKNRSRMLAEGMVAGVPDLFLAVPAGGYHGLFIEMKRRKLGKVSDCQLEMIEALRSQGYRVEVCYGQDEAIGVFRDYLKGSEVLR